MNSEKYQEAVRQIRPVHFFTVYEEWLAALEQVKGDIVSLPLVWQFSAEVLPTIEDFSAFVNAHALENWVFDDGSQCFVRFRASQFKQAAFDCAWECSEEGRFHPLGKNRS